MFRPPASIVLGVCVSVDGQLDQAALRSCYPESRLGRAALPALGALSPPTFLHAEVQEGQLPEQNLGFWQLHCIAALRKTRREPETLLQKRLLELKSS